MSPPACFVKGNAVLLQEAMHCHPKESLANVINIQQKKVTTGSSITIDYELNSLR